MRRIKQQKTNMRRAMKLLMKKKKIVEVMQHKVSKVFSINNMDHNSNKVRRFRKLVAKGSIQIKKKIPLHISNKKKTYLLPSNSKNLLSIDDFLDYDKQKDKNKKSANWVENGFLNS